MRLRAEANASQIVVVLVLGGSCKQQVEIGWHVIGTWASRSPLPSGLG